MPEQFGYEDGKASTWTLNGVGFDKLTLSTRPRPQIGPDQVLARSEVCTICFSSVKEILSGSAHPRLAHIDLTRDPITLGDEGFLVLEQVGENLKDRFVEGAGYSVVPDFGASAFGYDIPGALGRYSIIEGRILDYLIPVDMESVNRVGMFGVALSEPIACIEKSLTLGYRTAPKRGGVMLIVSDGSADATLKVSGGLAQNAPAKIVVAKAGAKLRADIEGLAKGLPTELVFTDMNVPDARTRQFSQGGWDDLVVVTNQPGLLGEWVKEGLSSLAKGGVMALLADVPAGTMVELELGTYHYDDTLIVGATDGDLTHAYTRNSDFGLRPGGTTAFVGAGGPMGQVGLLWAMAQDKPCSRLLAIDALDNRLEQLADLAHYSPDGCKLECINGMKHKPAEYLNGRELDYLVMLAPVPAALESYLPFLADNAVINLFAGLRGKYIKIDAHDLCARGIRLVGHSGDDIPSQTSALGKILSGKIHVEPVVAAVGGADAAWDALWATHLGTYPGKIAIYMGCRHPLVSVAELTGGEPWNAEHERKFIAANRWEGRL